MKRAFTIIVAIVCCIVLSSCSVIPLGFNESSEYDPASWGADDYPFAKETALEVIKCLDDNDCEKLKSLLSEEVISECDIDERIETALNFYKGKSISHDEVRSDIRSSEFREDHYDYKCIRIIVKNILTDEDETYNMELYYVLVDVETPSRVGISEIIFRDSEGVPLLDLFKDLE